MAHDRRAASTPPWPIEIAPLMPRLRVDLARLVAIPSVFGARVPGASAAAPGRIRGIVELLCDAGVENPGALELPETAPMVTGEIPAPEGAPTVLLHGHDDVVPAGDAKCAHVHAANERVLVASRQGARRGR